MRAQMQKLMGMVQGQEAVAGMGDLMESLKADEKVKDIVSNSEISFQGTCFSESLCIITQAPPGTARRKRRHVKPRQKDLDAVLS